MGTATDCFGTLARPGTAQSLVRGLRTHRDNLKTDLAAGAFVTSLAHGLMTATLSTHRMRSISVGTTNNPPNKPGNHQPHGADNMNRSKQNRSYEIKTIPGLNPHLSAV